MRAFSSGSWLDALVTLVLLALLALIHNQLALAGDGGVARAQALQAPNCTHNKKPTPWCSKRVERLRSEAQDLKTATRWWKKKARGELGMLKPGEILYSNHPIRLTASAQQAIKKLPWQLFSMGFIAPNRGPCGWYW